MLALVLQGLEKLRQVEAVVLSLLLVVVVQMVAEVGLTMLAVQAQHHLRFLHKPQHLEDMTGVMVLTQRVGAVVD
jgi:Mn2+/Fe2+ NRAMP family transporter